MKAVINQHYDLIDANGSSVVKKNKVMTLLMNLISSETQCVKFVPAPRHSVWCRFYDNPENDHCKSYCLIYKKRIVNWMRCEECLRDFSNENK